MTERVGTREAPAGLGPWANWCDFGPRRASAKRARIAPRRPKYCSSPACATSEASSRKRIRAAAIRMRLLRAGSAARAAVGASVAADATPQELRALSRLRQNFLAKFRHLL